MRLLDAFQNLTADANRRLFGVDLFHMEESFGIVLAIFPAEFVAALRNPSHAAPLAVRDFKDAVYQLAGGDITFAIKNSRILVFNRRPFQLPVAAPSSKFPAASRAVRIR